MIKREDLKCLILADKELEVGEEEEEVQLLL